MSDLESLTSPVEPLHVVPGRPRFRVPGLYHCPASKHEIERELALRHQIRRVSANPLTGNVLVEFDKQIDPGRIAALLQETVSVGGCSTSRGCWLSRPANESDCVPARSGTLPLSSESGPAGGRVITGRLRAWGRLSGPRWPAVDKGGGQCPRLSPKDHRIGQL